MKNCPSYNNYGKPLLTLNDSRESCSWVYSSSPFLLPFMCACRLLRSLYARYPSKPSSSSMVGTLLDSRRVTALSNSTPSLHSWNNLPLRGRHWSLEPSHSSIRDTGTVTEGLRCKEREIFTINSEYSPSVATRKHFRLLYKAKCLCE